jgi:hypothetical protein
MYDKFIHPRQFNIINCIIPKFLSAPQKKEAKLTQNRIHSCRQLFLDHFQDAFLMNSIGCYFQWLIYSNSATKYGTNITELPIIGKQVEKFESNLIPIGSGKSGFVYASQFMGTRFPIIIKLPLHPSSFTEVLHEYIIGTKGTNLLRLVCPNYCFIYAIYYQMSCKTIGEVTECSPNRLLMEHIQGMTLSKFISNIVKLEATGENIEEFLKVFFQIVLALEVGQETMCFTHYDFHPANIMIRSVKTIPVLEYPILDQTIALYDISNVVTFIDFAHACIKNKEGYIGKGFDASFPNFGMFPFYIPGADLFKLLINIWLEVFNLRKGENYTVKSMEPDTMGYVLSDFFKYILEEFFRFQTYDSTKKLFIEPRVYGKFPNGTNLYSIYKSPYSLIDCLNKNEEHICKKILGTITNFPWTLNDELYVNPTSMNVAVNDCFKELYCANLTTNLAANVYETTWNLDDSIELNNNIAEIILKMPRIPKLQLQYLNALVHYFQDVQLWNYFELYMTRIMTLHRLGIIGPSHVEEFYQMNKEKLQYFYRAYVCVKGYLSYLHEMFKIPSYNISN